MNLDDAQKKAVSAWIREGLKLSDIQTRLGKEFGLTLTYMEVRLLVDDLKLTPKDQEPPKPPPSLAAPAASASGQPKKGIAPSSRKTPVEDEQPPGSVSVSVDQLARPGAVASGKVTFSDGQIGEWYFDQTGRLGLVPPSPGYRPSQADLQQFQLALDQELSKMGF